MDTPLPSALLAELAAIVGDAHVLTAPDVVGGHTTDWTGRFVGPITAVVRPASTAEVAAVVRACTAAGVALVPQGGNTGLVGGSVPHDREVVLSLRRLDHLHVDAAIGQATAGAGVTIATLQQAAAAAGWAYGIDLASRESATVGGTIATNAGGLRVLRFGDTRAQVLGIEAVLADGSVVSHLGGLLRDNTGYHLPALVCGSEGTLAVVTAARLRLVPPRAERVVALLAFDALPAALGAAVQLRRASSAIEAVEFFVADGLALVCEAEGLPAPFATAHPAYLLVEAAAATDPADELERAIATLSGVADAAVATTAARQAELWAYRERHTTAINRVGVPHKLDVGLPLGRLAEFVAAVPAAVAAVDPAARVWLFGHAADGNVHVNVTGPAADDDRVDDAVLRLVVAMGGSISAEHGIGVAKLPWLALNRSAAERAAFARLKQALDPSGVLNPAVRLGAEA